MPRRIIQNKKEHRRERSLGWLAVWFAETFIVHGRGDVTGMPVKYGDEYAGFFVDCYALDADGRRLYDSAFLSRPKGTDKSGIAAVLVLFETFGPCRFAGWAKGGETFTFLGKTYVYAAGEPMGKPVTNPMVRIMATEEGQAGNVYDSVYHNLSDEDAPLHSLVKLYGVDVGLTRILIPKSAGGGEIRPSTAGSSSKDGGLETFAVFDETHLYTTDGLRTMYKTVARNLRKRRKTAETWYIETTTMYAPGEESIAEQTYELADLIQEGKARRPRLFFDHRWGDPGSVMKRDDEDQAAYEKRLADAFRDAYGDAMEWNDLEGLLDGLFDTRQTESETRRYFFNALVAATNAWVQLHEWSKAALKERRKAALAAGLKWTWRPPAPGDTITLGFDGSRTDDATVLIACRVSDCYVWPILIEEAPDTKEAKDWEVDGEKVDAKVAWAFKTYNVVGFFADPPYWQDEIDRWERDFGDSLKVHATNGKSTRFYTNRDAQMIEAVERAHTAIVGGNVIHGNHLALNRHVLNARRWARRGGVVIGKDKKGSKRKMDAAIGMVLALEARARFVKDDKGTGTQFTPFNPRGSARRRR